MHGATYGLNRRLFFADLSREVIILTDIVAALDRVVNAVIVIVVPRKIVAEETTDATINQPPLGDPCMGLIPF